MKLTEFYKKYGFNNALSMLNAMLSEPVTGYTQNSPIARENFKKLLNERNYEFELPDPKRARWNLCAVSIRWLSQQSVHRIEETSSI